MSGLPWTRHRVSQDALRRRAVNGLTAVYNAAPNGDPPRVPSRPPVVVILSTEKLKDELVDSRMAYLALGSALRVLVGTETRALAFQGLWTLGGLRIVHQWLRESRARLAMLDFSAMRCDYPLEVVRLFRDEPALEELHVACPGGTGGRGAAAVAAETLAYQIPLRWVVLYGVLAVRAPIERAVLQTAPPDMVLPELPRAAPGAWLVLLDPDSEATESVRGQAYVEIDEPVVAFSDAA